jgi:hypothetical protein
MRYVAFGNNLLEEINPLICKAKNMNYVAFIGNHLKVLPDCLFDLPKIQYINAGDNRYSKETIAKYKAICAKLGLTSVTFDPELSIEKFH